MLCRLVLTEAVANGHSTLMFAARITLTHFSVSLAISLAKSEGEPTIGVPPSSARRGLNLGSARASWEVLVTRFQEAFEQYKKRRLTGEEAGEHLSPPATRLAPYPLSAARADSFGLDAGRYDDRPPFLNLCHLQGGKRPRILLLLREDFLPNFCKALTDSSVS
jgi:hypothetical protein